MYIAVKFLHLAFVSVWFASLLALPWVFSQHARRVPGGGMTEQRRLERTIYFGIMTPAAVLAVLFGVWLLFYGFAGGWLPVKLTLIVIAVVFHLYCGTVMLTFLQRRNTHGRWYFRLWAQLPLLLLMAIVYLAAVKPF
jgi:putative membrane protein